MSTAEMIPYEGDEALNLSLAVRFVPGFLDPGPRAVGGALNALTIVAFALILAYAILSGARRDRAAHPTSMVPH